MVSQADSKTGHGPKEGSKAKEGGWLIVKRPLTGQAARYDVDHVIKY